ncbi:hypothetical protein IE53DRAFT_395025 [Violaceomyces palustris]|uniref:Uncharacterized protein n=1 Tax=Violaceomyces palustris TaxID=1673888 RepID=A0ACD0NXT2_9BASI|nr:hypothetical protein IE53DRAFT_395025 [Violaceomyces palustris]
MHRYIDIGVNLTDPVFRGKYHGKVVHQDDLDIVLKRARSAGVNGLIITGGSLDESIEAAQLAQQADDLYITTGCHPTRSGEFESYKGGAEAYLEALAGTIEEHRFDGKGKGKVVAVGECGLDYDRLHFAPAVTQKKYFEIQLQLAIRFGLPLFLHSRAAHTDFVSILKPRIQEIHASVQSSPARLQSYSKDRDDSSKLAGVVHSFTGTVAEAKELLDLGLFIGINGCSLKTDENLDVVREIPLDRIMLETDAPWCEPRPTHASHRFLNDLKALEPALHSTYMPPQSKKERWTASTMVKGRCEPCVIGGIAAVVAGIKGVSIDEVATQAWDNTCWLFGLPDRPVV